MHISSPSSRKSATRPAFSRDWLRPLSLPGTLTFSQNSARISGSGQARLRDFFSKAKASGFIITGHTDSRASDAYNMRLSLSRANRSVRLFAHVIERLAKGLQPEMAEVEAVGYLMRTTAVYGNGKFGIADYARLQKNP